MPRLDVLCWVAGCGIPSCSRLSACMAGAGAAACWGLTAVPGQVPGCALSHPWGRHTDRSGLILEKGIDGEGKWQRFRMCRCYLPRCCFRVAARQSFTGLPATLAGLWAEGPSSPPAGGAERGCCVLARPLELSFFCAFPS